MFFIKILSRFFCWPMKKKCASIDRVNWSKRLISVSFSGGGKVPFWRRMLVEMTKLSNSKRSSVSRFIGVEIGAKHYFGSYT